MAFSGRTLASLAGGDFLMPVPRGRTGADLIRPAPPAWEERAPVAPRHVAIEGRGAPIEPRVLPRARSWSWGPVGVASGWGGRWQGPPWQGYAYGYGMPFGGEPYGFRLADLARGYGRWTL